MKKKSLLLLLVVLLVASTYLLTIWRYQVGIFDANNVRDGKLQLACGNAWAQPLSLAGLPNLHWVSQDLYRGAQPEREGVANLQALGIKTVVCLRDDDQDPELFTGTGMAAKHIAMNAMRAPSDQQVVEFLKLFSKKQGLPVFVHCRQGADRTGTMCAIYRIVVQGWSKQAAIDEMSHGGFGFHASFAKLLAYIQSVDVERLRLESGLSTALK